MRAPLFVFATIVLTGCATQTQPLAAPTDRLVQPKVNRLVLAVAPPMLESNEMRHLVGPTSWQLRPMYESLVGVDPKTGALVPQLATEWSIEPNQASIRYKLRRGVPFHPSTGSGRADWGEFTAKDVPVAWKENVKEDSLTLTRPYWARTLKDIEIVNDYEVIHHLNRPDGYFFESNSEARGNMEVMSLAQLQQQGPATMQSAPLAGTGPYRYKERAQGSYLRYERAFEKHWRTNPEFPEFEFPWVKEPSTRLAPLLTGEIQMADLPQDLRAQTDQKGFKVILGKVPALRTFVEFYCCSFRDMNDYSKGYHQAESPLREKRVRQALTKAVNRDELNKAFFAGKGEVLYMNHMHKSGDVWNPDWERRFQEVYGFDPTRARALLAEAGHGPGNPVTVNLRTVAVAGYSGAEDVAEAVANFWRNVGVTVNLFQMEETQFQNGASRQFQFSNHAQVAATNATRWTGQNAYSTSLGPRRGVELGEVDDLLKQTLGTLDEHRQKELWRRVGDARFEAIQEVPLFWLPVEVVADSKTVEDWLFPGSISGSWSHVDLIKAAR